MTFSSFDSRPEADSIQAASEGTYAVLIRHADGTISVQLRETFPETVEFRDGHSVKETVDRIQRAEIERVARTLGYIRNQFTARLTETGNAVAGLTREVQSEETRDWYVNAQRISIASFTTTTDERLTKPDGVSESSLVDAYFSVLIADRIEGIQTIYRQVMQDITDDQSRAPVQQIPDDHFVERR